VLASTWLTAPPSSWLIVLDVPLRRI